MLNLDTHILLHAVSGVLKPSERKLLSTERWSISPIVLWEVAKLAQLGRIAMDLQDPRRRASALEAHSDRALSRGAAAALDTQPDKVDGPFELSIERHRRRDIFVRNRCQAVPGSASARRLEYLRTP